MKKILITGANSYIGTSFENWVSQWPEQYEVDTLDMTDPGWKEKSFEAYDSVFHVAGIAHSDTKKASEETKALYYKVNRDLTIETAKKAKKDGVKQFIFMSSIIVYGESGPIGKRRLITKDTEAKPANFYGNSKLQAEKGIRKLEDPLFKVVILRPPMIYGPGSKGNYPVLARFAKKFPIFPDIKNERSMLFIDNLCEFIKLMIENEETGTFFPQNEHYVSTSELVKMIGEVHGKKMRLVKIFNPLLRAGAGILPVINKVFGNMSYKKELSNYAGNYQTADFYTSIKITEMED